MASPHLSDIISTANMKLFKKLLPITFLSILLSGCNLPFIGQKQAALQVNSDPQAVVYLNENHVGQTPYFDDKLKPGEYTLKLQLEQDTSKEWQTQLTLSPKIITVISYTFGDTPERSSHYMLQLEPLASKDDTEISIITILLEFQAERFVLYIVGLI